MGRGFANKKGRPQVAPTGHSMLCPYVEERDSSLKLRMTQGTEDAQLCAPTFHSQAKSFDIFYTAWLPNGSISNCTILF